MKPIYHQKYEFRHSRIGISIPSTIKIMDLGNFEILKQFEKVVKGMFGIGQQIHTHYNLSESKIGCEFFHINYMPESLIHPINISAMGYAGINEIQREYLAGIAEGLVFDYLTRLPQIALDQTFDELPFFIRKIFLSQSFDHNILPEIIGLKAVENEFPLISPNIKEYLLEGSKSQNYKDLTSKALKIYFPRDLYNFN